LNFTTEKARLGWEEEVEVEVLRQEVISRYLDMSKKEEEDIKPKLAALLPFMETFSIDMILWALKHNYFSIARMKEIRSLLFDIPSIQKNRVYVGGGVMESETHPLTSRYRRITVEDTFKPYIKDAVTL
jgi:hypothetical protein